MFPMHYTDNTCGVPKLILFHLNPYRKTFRSLNLLTHQMSGPRTWHHNEHQFVCMKRESNKLIGDSFPFV